MLYKIFPKTTFEESNKRTCYQFDAQRQDDDNEEETSDNDEDTDVDDTESDSSTYQESSGDDETEETDEDEKGARKPRAVNNENTSDNTRIKPQTVLPDCTNFKYIGKRVLIAQ